MFLLLHEYGHIVCGHVDALASIHSADSFEEKLTNISVNNFPASENSYVMFRQTCEYDADAWATNILLQFVKSRVEGTASISPLLAFVFKNYESAVYYYNFSVYAYWRLFGMEYEFGINLLSQTHPPSGLRQHFIMALIHTVFQPLGMDYANRIGIQSVNAVWEVEEAFNQISEQGYNPKGISTTYHKKEHKEHGENIIANWKNVRPILEPFAYVKLAPI